MKAVQQILLRFAPGWPNRHLVSRAMCLQLIPIAGLHLAI